MDYIELIKKFWILHETHQFSVTEIALYFHILEISNRCSCINPFKRNSARICSDLGVSINTLKNARNRLSQANLISFSSKAGSVNVSYSITTSSKFDEVSSEVGPRLVARLDRGWTEVGSANVLKDLSVSDLTLESVSVSESISKIEEIKENKTKEKEEEESIKEEEEVKENKTKEKKEKSEKEKNFFGFDFSEVREDYHQQLRQWLEYKTQRREKYKTQKSFMLLYKQLCKFSGDNPKTAVLIVEQSMANNWAGLFELKTSQGSRLKQNDGNLRGIVV